MGYYIQTNGTKQKAEWIKANAGGQDCALGTVGDAERVPVVVVDNGPFEAAGVAFDLQELRAFTGPDHRQRRQLLVPKEQVIRLCPEVADVLNW